MKILILTALLFSSLASATASTVRFTDLDTKDLNSILNGLSDQIVEFRRGDLEPKLIF